jgi:hypothetical protein
MDRSDHSATIAGGEFCPAVAGNRWSSHRRTIPNADQKPAPISASVVSSEQVLFEITNHVFVIISSTADVYDGIQQQDATASGILGLERIGGDE